MTRSPQLAHELHPAHAAHPFANTFKRLGPVVVAVLAIGLATGAAFVALVWLDSSIRFLTPAVIRLGETPPVADPVRVAPAAPALDEQLQSVSQPQPGVRAVGMQ